jgi:hypothetical protein
MFVNEWAGLTILVEERDGLIKLDRTWNGSGGVGWIILVMLTEE